MLRRGERVGVAPRRREPVSDTRTDQSRTDSNPENEKHQNDDSPRRPPLRAPGTSVSAGQFIGRFIVLETLGTGGMGIVFLAYDPALNRNVAVKLLRPDLSIGGRADVR